MPGIIRMSEILTNFQGSHFLLSKEADSAQLQALLDLTRSTPRKNGGTLSGRGGVSYGAVQGFGPLVAKRFLRGGLLGHFIRSWHIMSREPRSVGEYRLLQKVRALGVNAPEPVACVWRGRFLYETWLFMAEIPDYQSLADISIEYPERLSQIFSEVGRQVGILIDNGILHIDLHPGNVIVDRNGVVFLLDFDKAREPAGTREEIRDQYIFRWRRAVIKHNLPDELAEMFCCSMRQIQC